MAHPRIVSAFRAMKVLGISEDKVKPVLKRLLKLYNKNWDLIEEENYRPLIDAIFDNEEAEEAKRRKSSKNAEEDNLEEEEVVDEEPMRPLKRSRLRQEAEAGLSSPSSLGGTSQVRHDVEGAELLGLHNSSNGHMDSEPQPASCQYIAQNKGKQPVSPNAQLSGADKSQPSSCSAGTGLGFERGKEVLSPQIMSAKKPSSEPSNAQSSKKKFHALIKPKEEPVTGGMHQEVPVSGTHAVSAKKGGSSNANGSIGNEDHPLDPKMQSGATLDLALSSEARANDKLEVASSTSGEVKVILNCSAVLGRPNFEMPSLDAVVKLMEEKCLSEYKDVDPKFSVIKVMQDVCECFLELRAQSSIASEATRDE
ncbi:PREDICTED: probable inactive histone-lysine N-methyltransferase SUVR1 isoform X2 [Ipomoea nil]|uniref:probable inactive histone-lysine N-methyltransferase SUVR1 isoform X2 n=1 Tax=Ipomoea nil TaxID=35883 RepID=UPI000901BE16|nr:PREDICTED: probable inactive histone-lysine N-methyltransferase SUVR1 isoform X2 [Ipomoea nil]XP_019188407.1 PREDICTED: probable inactive histone-lysine N-methyltransferase SUVR1 isoform X2 [Ipomoea nil]